MNKSRILLATLLVMGLWSCGRSSAPEQVKQAFVIRFPDIIVDNWDIKGENEWEAEFMINGIKYLARFSEEGEWLETEYEIRLTDLPETVKSRLSNDFIDYEIKEVEVLETMSGITYEFEIENDDHKIEVVIDPLGKLIEKTDKGANDS